MSRTFESASHALVGLSTELITHGELVSVRGKQTRELTHQTITITRPLDRAIRVPGRHNNPFATIAETMWVIAGRDDIGFLMPYLPRAADYSDDGVTWRGAYGPRLRNWAGVDQVHSVVRILNDESASRRATMSIFDPAKDFVASRDIPCTNWLNFSVRNGQLSMAVALRSNDLIWGFSGINTFEWSVLQEMLAFWIGAEVGSATYFISSLHLYENHFERANVIARGAKLIQSTDPGSRFSTSFDSLPGVLNRWFELEHQIRSRIASATEIASFDDPLLRDFLWMINAYWAAQMNGIAGGKDLLHHVLDPGLRESAELFFAWQEGSEPSALEDPWQSLVPASLLRLHAAKDAVYGDSWKRRGELMSILPNLARKIDRLIVDRESESPAVENLLDTAADLLIYALKYKAFLLDAAAVPPPKKNNTWSDGTAGVELLMSALDWDDDPDPMLSLETSAKTLDQLESSARASEPPEMRIPSSDLLVDSARALLIARMSHDLTRATSELRGWGSW